MIERGMNWGPPVKNIEGIKIELPVELRSIDQLYSTELSNIIWNNHDVQLLFERVKETFTNTLSNGQTRRVILYSAKLVIENKPPIDLSNILKKPIYFTGSENGFYLLDPSVSDREEISKLKYYVVAVNTDQLENNIQHMASLYHEIGHAVIVDKNIDTNIFLTIFNYATKKSYKASNLFYSTYSYIFADHYVQRAISEYNNTKLGVDLTKFVEDCLKQPDEIDRKALWEFVRKYESIDNFFRLLHERSAWAIGIRLMAQHKTPSGFDKKSSLIKYAKFCLGTYASYFNDSNFTTRWVGRKNPIKK